MFTRNAVHAIAGSKKVDILKQLEGECQDAGLTLHLLAKPKKEDGREQIEELLSAAKATSDNAVVGGFPKVSFININYENWALYLRIIDSLNSSLACCRTRPAAVLLMLGQQLWQHLGCPLWILAPT